MSLNKKVCMKCCDRDGRAPWNESDEHQWKRGSVTCPHSPHLRFVKEKPNADCPYVLEHVVSETKQKDMQEVH
jgi:hypothetical protein